MLSHTFLPSSLRLFTLACLLSTQLQAATLVGEQDDWKFWKGTSIPSNPDPTNWRQPDFDDAHWPTSNAPFFYENNSGFTGNTDLNDMQGNYSCIFLRRAFRIDTAPPPQLTLDAWSDDGCIVWINGVEVLRLNVPDGEIPYYGTSNGALGEPNVAGIRIENADTFLNTGENVIAVQALNSSLAGSSDFYITVTLASDQDLVAPQIVAAIPEANARIRSLSDVQVVFSESVQGVNATDLRLNGTPATSLTAVAGRPVNNAQELRNAVRAKGVGSAVELDVLRGTKSLKLKVTPEEWPQEMVADADAAPGRRAAEAGGTDTGMTLKPMDANLAKEFGIEMAEGLLVTSIQPGSLAERRGVQKGDIVTEVDRAPISSLQDYRAAMKATDLKKGTLLNLVRDGVSMLVVLKDTGE